MISRTSPPSIASRVLSRFTSPADVLLAVRIVGWACLLPALKLMLPIPSLVGIVRRAPRRESRDAAREERIVTFSRWACRLTRWRSGGNCLERGLIAYRFLGDGRADPTLVVGMRRGSDGEITGHAWVLLDGKPAGETLQSVSKYVQVFAFGPDGVLLRPPLTASSNELPSLSRLS